MLGVSVPESGGVRIVPATPQAFCYDVSRDANVIEQEAVNRLSEARFTTADGAGEIESNGVRVRVLSNPFVVEVYDGDREVVRFNAAQRLAFELGGQPLRELHNGFTDAVPHGRRSLRRRRRPAQRPRGASGPRKPRRHGGGPPPTVQ